MRISIEVTDTQHKILKANAALQGQSIKEYVLERTIPTPDEETALKELEAFITEIKSRVIFTYDKQ